jgi:caspase 7
MKMAKMYNMDHAKRGIALVVNIRTYNPNPFKLNERKWSEPDVENLKQSLQYLEFDLKLHENLTAKEIRDEIQKIADRDHSNSDCFLCVVMSHGIDDKIMACDSEEISFDEIMAPVKSCPSLENKPKLFFFQACRGDKEMEATSKRPDSGTSTTSGHGLTDHINELKKNNKTHALKQNTKIESEADLLVYYSTIPNHYSYGTEAEGTFFIKSLCKELNEAYKNLPNNLKLLEMSVNINKSVREKGMQLAEPMHRLMADVNFKPKNVGFKQCYLFIYTV